MNAKPYSLKQWRAAIGTSKGVEFERIEATIAQLDEYRADLVKSESALAWEQMRSARLCAVRDAIAPVALRSGAWLPGELERVVAALKGT